MKSDIFDFIEKTVTDFYQVDKRLLLTRCRKRELVFPRQVIYYFCKKYDIGTSQKIGELYNRDHATFLHSYKAVSNIIETSKKDCREIERMDYSIRTYIKEIRKNPRSKILAQKKAIKWQVQSGCYFSPKELQILVHYFMTT